MTTARFETARIAEIERGSGWSPIRRSLGVQAFGILVVAAFVFCASAAVFYACKKTIGLRVDAQQELEGLDIHEHGMWGYPEQFLPGYGASQPYVLAPSRRPPAPATAPVTAFHNASLEGGD